MENGLVKKVIDVLLPCIFPKSNTFRYISNVEMSTSAVKKELVGWVFLGDDILPNHMGRKKYTIIPDPYENQRTRASHVIDPNSRHCGNLRNTPLPLRPW